MMDKNENKEMIEAVALLAKEKNISKEVLFSAIEEALKSAYKNNFNKQYGIAPSNANVRVELDRVTGAVRLFARKTVVEWVIDEAGNCGVDGKKHEECTVCDAMRNAGVKNIIFSSHSTVVEKGMQLFVTADI